MTYLACKNLCRISIITFLILAIFATPTFAQYFIINKFCSDITINEDASITVTEAINVEFNTLRHGIYREIPFKYVNELGRTTKTPLEVLYVTNEDGRDWKYSVQKTGNIVNIRIGDAYKYVGGRQTYVITYKVENAILFFDDHDELYWNVTGNYWKALITEAFANITLATKDKSKNLWAACYTGVYGSTESACVFEENANGGQFFTKKSLHPGEGLTVAFGWDKGLVTPPSRWKRFLWTIDIKENWVFSLPFVSLITMVSLWSAKGRDPRVRKSITVMYEPPKDKNVPLTSAEVGTLIDERLHPRDVSAAIVGLAVKGYIKIKEIKQEGLIFSSTDYELTKIKEPGEDLSLFEIQLMEKIFSGACQSIRVSDLKNNFYTNLQSLKEVLYERLVRKGYFLVNPEKVRTLYTNIGILVMVLSLFAFAILFPFSPGQGILKGILVGIISGLPVIAFGRVMPAKTRAGASVYMDILGFQEFLNRAEKDRLERMEDKDLFSKFLPYAIALDVVDNWAKAFEGIYQEPPKWYESDGGIQTFSPRGFSHSINSATSSFASAMFSAPRGSGIGGGGGVGGGGSSGGGFGGGGGGSW